MKMIHRGTAPAEKKYRSTCNVCRSVFEYQASEATYVLDRRDGDYLWFKCEVCGNRVTHDVARYIDYGDSASMVVS